jgi:hypothetical protein
MKRKLYLQENKDKSFSVKEICGRKTKNLAWIDIGGPLNFKEDNGEFISNERYIKGDILNRYGINITFQPNWFISNDGKTAGGVGTGFEGWLKFNNTAEAIKWLEKYYELVYCK